MNYKKLLEKLQKELLKKANKSLIPRVKYFFKEPINPIGITHPEIKKTALDFFKQHEEQLDFKTTVKICESLLKTGIYEFGIASFHLFQKHEKSFDAQTINLIERWVLKYFHNWAFCDSLCPKSAGFLFEKKLASFSVFKKWASSKNLWLRRCSIVSFVNISRKKDYTKQVTEISKLLLNDKEDLIHKAVGWTLRESAKPNEKAKKAVLFFLRKNKFRMPRTMLRYAIERFSEKEKKELMAK